MRRVVVASIGNEIDLWTAAVRSCRKELNDARHRVRSEERRMGAAQHFDPLDVLWRDRREIKGATRLVQRYAVEQYLVVSRLASANEEPCQTTNAAAADGDDARHGAQQIDCADRMALLDRLSAEHRDRRADFRLG